MKGWQPINTLPVNGKICLIYSPKGRFNDEPDTSKVFEAHAKPDGTFSDPVYSEWNSEGATYWMEMPRGPILT